MGLRVTTATGTRYILRDGRVTRCRTVGDTLPPVLRACFKHVGTLAVGEPMVLRIPTLDARRPLITTPVRSIERF